MLTAEAFATDVLSEFGIGRAPGREGGVLPATADNPWQMDALLAPWLVKLRSTQRPPSGNWFIWLIRAGRGWGKTLTGALWILQASGRVPRIAIVAATFGDGRDYCIEGETGIKTICPDLDWNRSIGEMTFPSGCRGKLFSAEEPDRMRGPNIYAFWCDEYAAWKYRKKAFDQLMLMARKGDDLRGVITTTPKPGALKDLEARPTTVVTRGATRENLNNLSPVYIREVVDPLEATTLGRQELNAEDIDDTPGALWKRAQIDALRVTKAPDLTRLVVAVDPAATAHEDSNETGIIVAGVGADQHAYVLDDMTIKGSPATWAKQAIAAYHKYQADHIVYETNQGGDMVLHTLTSVIERGDPIPPMRGVHASRGKQTRAEPISGLYEKGKVHHVAFHASLEDQLCSWVPGDKSPDRLDALVWALTDLMIGNPVPDWEAALG